MNRLSFGFFVGFGILAAALGGCIEGDGNDHDDGVGGGGSDDSSGTGSGPTRTDIGTIQVFVINPTDATVSIRDPYQGDDSPFAWTVLPRQGQWIDAKLYGSGCPQGASSCGALAVEGIPDVTALDFPAVTDAQLVLPLDRSSAVFEQSEVLDPNAGNASIRYVGSSLFGTIVHDELESLTGVTSVPDQVQVGYDDGEGGFTVVQDGGRPFVGGQRYFVDGKRTEPPSLLVCNLSQESPAIGCFDYLLED